MGNVHETGAHRALGRLDGSIQTLPHPDLFVFMYVRREAVLSSQIEGTQSSLQDVLAAEAQILSPDRPQDGALLPRTQGTFGNGLRKPTRETSRRRRTKTSQGWRSTR